MGVKGNTWIFTSPIAAAEQRAPAMKDEKYRTKVFGRQNNGDKGDTAVVVSTLTSQPEDCGFESQVAFSFFGGVFMLPVCVFSSGSPSKATLDRQEMRV